MSKKVCVIIPAFNESTVITKVVKDITKEFKKSNCKATIVVVNDSSEDDTSTLARQAGATVIDHIMNSGAGGATATGLRFADMHGFDIGVTMDADGQHSPKDVVHGVEILSKSKVDLLIGSRLIDSQGMSRVKILGNRGLSMITNILFGVRVTDSQSGLRVFSKRALHKLKWKTTGYEFCSEMLWRAHQIGLHVDEYPIQAIYTDYSKAKGQNNWNAVNIIKSLIKRRIGELFG
ncbi:MAG TPA: glycosyltransferase family 2 protein [Candidatus Saccharimonadales bacterium]